MKAIFSLSIFLTRENEVFLTDLLNIYIHLVCVACLRFSLLAIL